MSQVDSVWAGKTCLSRMCDTSAAYVKGTVMQIEKALINDRFCVSKIS